MVLGVVADTGVLTWKRRRVLDSTVLEDAVWPQKPPARGSR